MHKWVKSSYPIRTYISYDGDRVGVFVCVCEKCGKKKFKKFY